MNFYNVTRFVAEDDMVMQGRLLVDPQGNGQDLRDADIWRFRDGKAVEFYECSTPLQPLPP